MTKRKQKSSEADALFSEVAHTAALVPWWITLPLAVLLFFFIPDIQLNITEFTSSSAVTALMGMFFTALFKYFVPLALVFGAVINIFKRFKSDSLFKSVKKNGAHQTVQKLSWQDFEFLLSEWFKKEGFSTELTGGGGADGGVDIKLYREGELYLVQCKHYKAWKVSVQVVRELFGVMAAEKAVGGYVVTSGKFTKDAIEFAEGKNLTLIDGAQLETILDSAEPAQVGVVTQEAKTCPQCGADLVERKGKRGKFLGCSTYPKCKHTEDLN
jgi:restriction system protein